MIEVGNTPLLEVDGIYAKLECANPTGSIKDRMVRYIIEQSEKQGILKPGMTIVEATSGNTGIALSLFARERGYSIIIIMPKNMSDERKRILRKLGANLILCSEGNFKEATKIRDEMAKKPNYFNPDQFSNPLNVECHYKTTAREILVQIKPHSDRIGAFVAGVGTGGTLIGVGKRLKEVFPDMRIVAVEPSESPVMSGGEPGTHGIQGIGDGFLPPLVSDGAGGLNELIDEILCVSTSDAKETAQYLGDVGICVGISSGANFCVAKRIAKKYGTTVTVFPDGYSKYKSLGLAKNRNGPCSFQEPKCSTDPKCYKKDIGMECKCY